MDKMKNETLWMNRGFVAIMAIIACVLWGSAFPVLKLTYGELQLQASDSITRLFLAGSRFFIAALLLFFLASFVLKQSLKLDRRWWKPLFFLGLAQTALQYYFFYNGLAHTGGIKAAVLNAVGNFLVVIVAHFVYTNDRLNMGKAIGLITGFAGIILVNWQGGTTGFSWDLSFKGEGFMLLSGVASVYGTFQAKKLAQNLNPIIINAYQLLIGSILLLIVGIPSFVSRPLQTTPFFWILLLYSAFLSAAAFSIWYTLLRYNKAGEVTLYRFVIPISGAFLSALILPEETLTSAVLIALGLVALGLIIVNSWRKKV